MLLIGNIILSIIYSVIAAAYIVLFNKQVKSEKNCIRPTVIFTIFIHFFFLIFLTFNRGQLALTTIFEVLSMIALLLAILVAAFEIKTGETSLGAFLFPLIASFQIFSLIGKRIPVLENSITALPLVSFHTLSTVIGYTCFIYSFILAVVYLVLIKRFNKKKYDKIFFRLPPLDLLENLNITALITGFIFMSAGLISGARLALIIWGDIPFLDPKIFLTILLWVVYLISFLVRFLFKFRGKTMSYASITGFMLILIIILLESLTRITLHRF